MVRTRDFLIPNQADFQLSYVPTILVGDTIDYHFGFSLPTPIAAIATCVVLNIFGGRGRNRTDDL